MNSPNQNQQEAILHMQGPMMVIAGPGSGKTFVIISRILNLLKTGINEENILVITFSKSAATEMKNRLFQKYGNSRIHFGTFHSLAYEILKKSFSFSNSSLIMEKDKNEILSLILKNMGFGSYATYDNLFKIISLISKSKNSKDYNCLHFSSPIEEISNSDFNNILKEYKKYLNENKYIDFDDMIINCIEKLKKSPDILTTYQNEYKYIMVDEFQDINDPQYDFLKLLCSKENNIFAVGDDDQSIYGFRGSNPKKMFDFLEDFPLPKKIILENNYRSSKKIVETASNIIKENKNRFSKNFIPLNQEGSVSFSIHKTKHDEELDIIKLIRKFTYEECNETAIILRTNREVIQYASLLKNNHIPICEKLVKNTSLFNSAIMKDIKAFLEFVYEGEHRDKFIIFMNKPDHKFQRSLLKDEIITENMLLDAYKYNLEMQNVVKSFFSKINLAKKLSISMAINILRKNIGYDKYISDNTKSKDEENSNLEILNKVQEYFLDYDFSLSINDYISKLNKNHDSSKKEVYETKGINLMTMHTSKGLEFKNVILPDVNEGIIPSKNVIGNGIEEERRLFYVAVTRARENLYIFTANERNRDVSRFIKKLI